MSNIYISGMTEDSKGGIFRCIWRGNAPQLEDFYPLERNLCLCWGPGRKTLYASSQHDGIGAVAAQSIDGFGGEYHQAAALENLGSPSKIGLLRGDILDFDVLGLHCYTSLIRRARRSDLFFYLMCEGYC